MLYVMFKLTGDNNLFLFFFVLLLVVIFTSFGEQEIIKLMLTPHDDRRQSGLSGIRTYDHPHASPKLYQWLFCPRLDNLSNRWLGMLEISWMLPRRHQTINAYRYIRATGYRNLWGSGICGTTMFWIDDRDQQRTSFPSNFLKQWYVLLSSSVISLCLKYPITWEQRI